MMGIRKAGEGECESECNTDLHSYLFEIVVCFVLDTTYIDLSYHIMDVFLWNVTKHTV